MTLIPLTKKHQFYFVIVITSSWNLFYRPALTSGTTKHNALDGLKCPPCLGKKTYIYYTLDNGRLECAEMDLQFLSYENFCIQTQCLMYCHCFEYERGLEHVQTNVCHTYSTYSAAIYMIALVSQHIMCRILSKYINSWYKKKLGSLRLEVQVM